jgi:hypothetical protein
MEAQLASFRAGSALNTIGGGGEGDAVEEDPRSSTPA